MSDEIKLTLSAEQTNAGSISGKGTISFKANLTDIRFHVDYRQQDHLLLNLSAQQGLKISTKGTLTFSGDLGHDLFNRKWDGSIKIELDINKSVSAALEHTFSQKKKSILFELKIDI